jgi:hemoglobin
MDKKVDIQSRADVELLIRSFYDKVLVDEQISFIFTDIAQIELEVHFPHLFDFWENVLLKPNGYKKNILKVHLDLNQKVPLTAEHFKQWLKLFHEAVDQLFEGEKANAAKNKATSIGIVMQVKLHSSNSLL